MIYSDLTCSCSIEGVDSILSPLRGDSSKYIFGLEKKKRLWKYSILFQNTHTALIHEIFAIQTLFANVRLEFPAKVLAHLILIQT